MAFSLHDYEILDTIGGGAFGVVYRARQKSLGRIVAIKSLAPQRAQDKKEIVRFRREAQAMAALAHDSIITVYDYAYQAGSYYIVMDYVEGCTFEDALNRHIEIGPAVQVLRRIADGLACAHARNIIHRDIKPSNILLDTNGRVKLADFGLAAFQQALTSQSMSSAVGTLCYMAPEAMVNPAEIDSRADIFSVGCVLFQAVSGRLPFPGETIAEVSYRVVNEDTPALDPPENMAPLADVTLGCLHKDRDKRPSAKELAHELTQISHKLFPGAADRLTEFIRCGGPRPAAAKVAYTTRPPLPRSKFRRRVAVRATMAGLAAAFVVGVITLRRSRRDAELLLPNMSPEREALTIEPTPDQKAAPQTAPNNNDGPGPLTSLSGDERAATLIVTGLTAGDTIEVNGHVVYVSSKAGSLGLPLGVGVNRLEVRGIRKKRRLSRSITASALEVVTWNLNERDTNYE
ncbi:MAG: protein kinase [Chitinivibrionales bacterium]|nr:protein kinase [Chitinivibrionales bacterium]MBD3359039.1 protein kinase [Chitinivibrionales bacterium]